MTEPAEICYLNGELIPLSDAKISVLDRGFIFGDGVYEIIPAFDGCLFRIEQHLDRFAASIAAIGIADPLERSAWKDVLAQLVLENGGGNQRLYVQVTRGVASRDHAFPAKSQPTIFAMSSVMTPDPRPVPVAVITAEDFRWSRCDIKSTSLLANVLLRQRAVDNHVYETVLVDNGQVFEGAASNVFIVIDNVIFTPPHSVKILAGITRDLLVELLTQTELAINEAPISIADFGCAEEIWLTSSSHEMVPVEAVDGRRLTAPGPVYQKVRAIYEIYKSRYLELHSC